MDSYFSDSCSGDNYSANNCSADNLSGDLSGADNKLSDWFNQDVVPKDIVFKKINDRLD